jgi:hypothetical protein
MEEKNPMGPEDGSCAGVTFFTKPVGNSYSFFLYFGDLFPAMATMWT